MDNGEIFVMIHHIIIMKLMSSATSWDILELQVIPELDLKGKAFCIFLLMKFL